MYIEQANAPADVKRMPVSGLKVLDGKIRQALLNKLSVHGRHVGPICAWWRRFFALFPSEPPELFD